MGRGIDWDCQLGHRLKLRNLHVLSTAIECGSMAKAAARLGISQPAVSEIIAELEHALGVRLLDRSRRGVEPTPYGRTLMRRSLAAFDELKQGIKEIESMTDPTIGEVRIGCAESTAAAILPPVIEQFARQYPHVMLRVDEVIAPTLEVPILRQRRLDMVLVRFKNSVAEEPADLDVETLFHDEMAIAAGCQNRWAKRERIALAELIDEPWILPPSNSWNYANIQDAFHAHGLTMPRISVMTFSVHLRNYLLTTGPYIAAYPKSVLQLNPNRSSLKVLPVDLPVRPWPVAAVTLKNRTLNPIAGTFLDHLRKFARLLDERPTAAKNAPKAPVAQSSRMTHTSTTAVTGT